jgi:hypothetical protein
MTPDQRAQAKQAEASALEPDHSGHGEPLEAGGVTSGERDSDQEWMEAQEAEAECLDEWDSADSAEYQARVGAGLEPEAE